MVTLVSSPKCDSAYCAPPKCSLPVTAFGVCHSMYMPAASPARRPASRPHACAARVYRPITIAGSVWTMITPPISCRSIENCVSSARITITAPTFTTSDARRLTFASSACVQSGRMYSR